MRYRAALIVILSLLLSGLGRPAGAQDAGLEPAAAEAAVNDTSTEAAPDAGQAVPNPSELVEVDWFEEMMQGGMTMVALAVLSVALLAFILERLIYLRGSRLVPPGLPPRLLPLLQQHRYDEARKLCSGAGSALERIVLFMLDHRKGNPQLLIDAAGDIGAREVFKQEQRCQPFAVIAGIAPLLGLLGTMIGMIESFKLVEVFGDEGGASLLAGSISKALITTAVGLILAIPALIAYHYFKHRTHILGAQLEEAAESLFTAWLFGPAAGEEGHRAIPPHLTPDGEHDHHHHHTRPEPRPVITP